MPPTAAATALPKQNLEHIEHPDGSITAVMTITFHDGSQQRYETTLTPEELEGVEGEFVGAELALIGPDGEVGSLFGFVKKAVKGIGKIAKAVVNSKIMKIAATGLAVASPILGPLAPFALAASAGLGIASKLANAGAAAARGAVSVAQELTAKAGIDAKALTKTPEGAAALLKAANAKRLAADALPVKLAKAKPAPKPPAKPAPKLAAVKPAAAKPTPALPAAQSEADLLARARAGRVRSNQKGAISDQQLLAAHKSGRVYWVL